MGCGIILFIIYNLKYWFVINDILFIENFEPDVSLIIAAYNEASVLKEKIIISLALDYRDNKLKIIFVTNGSNDASPEMIKAFNQQVQVYHNGAERISKIAAINGAMQFVSTAFVFFSDFNTYINPQAVREIIKHYTDEIKGAVAG